MKSQEEIDKLVKEAVNKVVKDIEANILQVCAERQILPHVFRGEIQKFLIPEDSDLMRTEGVPDPVTDPKGGGTR